MKRFVTAAVVAATLLAPACKKKSPEEPPPAPAAEAAPLEYSFGTATFTGTRVDGEGELHVSMSVTNKTSMGMTLRAVRVAMMSGETEICAAKEAPAQKLPPEHPMSVDFTLACSFSGLGEGKLDAKGLILFSAGEEDSEMPFTAQVAFDRS